MGHNLWRTWSIGLVRKNEKDNDWRTLTVFLKSVSKSAVTYLELLVSSTKGQLIVVVNGFQKKSQKTPKKEIELAEKLKKQYFDEKKGK